MSYNYELCFWDPNDDGVNILLEHISEGIKSCTSMVNFFKQRGELEKDYARRLGAINSKLRKDMDQHAEYGNLSKSFELALTNEKARAQVHSKQSEVIYRQIHSNIKSFAEQLQARYTTLSGKVERLRVDKYNKKVGCENLEKRLQEAQVRARDLQLNADNLIGAKRNEHNQKELTKWETTAKEVGLKLDVLRQEHKASQKYWFREWANVTRDLQELDTTRISFLKTKLQQYAEITIETSVLEQTRMDALTNQLVTYTPGDDISDFSSTYGTGRLREKRKSHQSATHSHRHMEHLDAHRKDSFGDTCNTHNDHDDFSTSKSRRSSYMDNLRRLSSHLQSIGNLDESRAKRHSTPPAIQYQTSLGIPQERHHDDTPQQEEAPQEKLCKSTVREARVIQPSSAPRDLDDTVPHSRYIPTRLSPMPLHRKKLSSSSSSSSPKDLDDTIPHSRHIPTRLSPMPAHTKEFSSSSSASSQPRNLDASVPHSSNFPTRLSPMPANTKELSSSSSESSSNPTDFTTHVRSRHSMDSMATSVSSFVNSIDDSQRFAKSWNSSNRKRKSISYVNQKSPPQSPPTPTAYHHGDDSELRYASHRHDRGDEHHLENVRNVSTDTTIVNAEMNASAGRSRRKSLVVKDSVNPIEDALTEMQKISSNGFAASDVRVGRIRDNGITVTLPLVTSDGEHVIKYAKAVYPLYEENVPELAQFQRGDYLLITGEVNDEWYRGEVYSNDYVSQGSSSGLIPHNFIKPLT
ncbi:hypothetical protein ZYGR_0R00490 [Zygosaccharomyces rouxii]|uniref:SH3 domain-containing protein n=1 Tax=Zygosaccharomyces rouxii TaxID=4956 RepID=A0A1Q3A294_ZYGRO|nr:hypothetical protein ZYGR_0R00490 [Zygosaccharomyces rouxii]